MSAGVHRLWKDIFMERLGPAHGTKLLDMAGGTGDIAFRYLKYLRNLPIGDESKTSHVTVSDINQNMLDVGKKRAADLHLTNEHLRNCTIDWVCANAEQLPFDDNSFSAYTIAFGIRNCTHIDKVCLSNIRRYRASLSFSLTTFLSLVFSDDIQCAGGERSVSRITARRTLHVPRIQPPEQSVAAMALRSIFVRVHPTDGTHLGRSMGSLSILGREHSTIPETGAVQGNHRRCWIRVREL